MNTPRTVRLTARGLRRIDEARRRLGVSRDDLATAPSTPSANTVRKALRGEPVFVRTVERLSDFLRDRAGAVRQPFEPLRESDDWVYGEPDSGAPTEKKGWISRSVPAPYRLFTGQADVLARLHAAFRAPNSPADPQAITGLGGIGKTQTALAYVFAHKSAYTRIFWANADTKATLDDSLSSIARELGIADGRGDSDAADRARNWFRDKTGWLLVLDNADDLEAVAPHFPPRHGGRFLITTRVSSTVRWAEPLPLKPLSPEAGALLLLRRAGRLSLTQTLDRISDDERVSALALSHDLGGLPLALNQAGALLAGTNRPVGALHDTLRQQGLSAIHTESDPEHAPVFATLTLAIDRLADSGADGRAATDLLRLCAFLGGEPIPETVVAGFGSDALAAAHALSLATRETSGVTVHRLVQAIFRETLAPEERTHWTRRAIGAVASATPDFSWSDWQSVAPLLPHWRACVQHIERLEIVSPDAAHLLYQTARFLRVRALYDEAAVIGERAVLVAERAFGPGDERLCEAVDELACLARETDRLADASRLHERAVEIARAASGANSRLLAAKRHNQALCETALGQYEHAIEGFSEARKIWERDPNDSQLAATASTQLGGALRLLGDAERAEDAFRRALDLYRQCLPPGHADIGIASNNLAMHLVRLGRPGEAEPLFLAALTICETARGVNHPETGTVLWGLARTRRAQNRPDEASAFYDRALAIYETAFPPGHALREKLSADRSAAQ